MESEPPKKKLKVIEVDYTNGTKTAQPVLGNRYTLLSCIFHSISILIGCWRTDNSFLDYVHTVSFSSVFICNAFQKVSFSRRVHTKTDEIDVN